MRVEVRLQRKFTLEFAPPGLSQARPQRSISRGQDEGERHMNSVGNDEREPARRKLLGQPEESYVSLVIFPSRANRESLPWKRTRAKYCPDGL